MNAIVLRQSWSWPSLVHGPRVHGRPRMAEVLSWREMHHHRAMGLQPRLWVPRGRGVLECTSCWWWKGVKMNWRVMNEVWSTAISVKSQSTSFNSWSFDINTPLMMGNGQKLAQGNKSVWPARRTKVEEEWGATFWLEGGHIISIPKMPTLIPKSFPTTTSVISTMKPSPAHHACIVRSLELALIYPGNWSTALHGVQQLNSWPTR